MARWKVSIWYFIEAVAWGKDLPHGHNFGDRWSVDSFRRREAGRTRVPRGETPGAEGRPAAPLQPRHLAQLPSTCREAGHLPVDWRTYQVVSLTLLYPAFLGTLLYRDPDDLWVNSVNCFIPCSIVWSWSYEKIIWDWAFVQRPDNISDLASVCK